MLPQPSYHLNGMIYYNMHIWCHIVLLEILIFNFQRQEQVQPIFGLQYTISYRDAVSKRKMGTFLEVAVH